MMTEQEKKQDWLAGMTEEELAFLKRFVLASGSLKQVAGEYGISYPTVRLRLDRLIEKVKLYDSQGRETDFERLLRSAHIDGKIDHAMLTDLLSAYRKETK